MQQREKRHQITTINHVIQVLDQTRGKKCQKRKVKKQKLYEKTDTDQCFFSILQVSFVRRSIYHQSIVFMVSAGLLPPARNSHGAPQFSQHLPLRETPCSLHYRFFAVIHSRYLWCVRDRIVCSALRGVYTTKGRLLAQYCWVESGDSYHRSHPCLLVVVLAIFRVWDLHHRGTSTPLPVADDLTDGRLPAPNNIPTTLVPVSK